jgi:tRNA C32,U32 (ribose-2'-O)-methylase TrmJ
MDLDSSASGTTTERLTPSSSFEFSSGRRRKTRVALVFGREELGLADEEVEVCDVACCIPIGRLQESLSLSHAVSIALSGIYSRRLEAVAAQAQAQGYLVASPEGLAEGIDPDAGIEI